MTDHALSPDAELTPLGAIDAPAAFTGTHEVPDEALDGPELEAPEPPRGDLMLRLLKWTTRTALAALVVVGATGIALGVLVLTHRSSEALAGVLQEECLDDAVAAAMLGMTAAAARAGSIERRRQIARTIARVTAEKARRRARRARAAARKAIAEREAAAAVAREAREARRAEEAAEEAAQEAERLAAETASAEAAERAREAEQRDRERRALEERIERAIRDGTRLT